MYILGILTAISIIYKYYRLITNEKKENEEENPRNLMYDAFKLTICYLQTLKYEINSYIFI